MKRKHKLYCKNQSLDISPSLLEHGRRRIQKFPDWVDNEINNSNKHSLKRNTKGYGGKTH
jgi:hypothetical protein